MRELSDELIAFLHGGASMLAASRDAELRSWMSRAVGVRVGADRRTLTCYIPDRAGAQLLAVAVQGAPLAVTVCRVSTLRTVQLKGTITAVRPAADRERPHIADQTGGYFEELAAIGFAPAVVERLTVWPATALELRIESLFEQTPGPGAGRQMEPSS